MQTGAKCGTIAARPLGTGGLRIWERRAAGIWQSPQSIPVSSEIDSADPIFARPGSPDAGIWQSPLSISASTEIDSADPILFGLDRRMRGFGSPL